MNVKVTKVGGRYAPKWSIDAAVPRKKVNGRKAWRRAAKKLRRKLREGAKARIPLVEHLPEKLAKCIANRLRRHGAVVAVDDTVTKLTTLFYVSFEAEISGWEAENKHRPKSWAERIKRTYWAPGLVGMSQSMRKRMRRMCQDTGVPGHGRDSEMWRVGERLKPCAGCRACRPWLKTLVQSSEQICDGFGVMPSKRGKPHVCTADDCDKPSIGRTDESWDKTGKPGYLCFEHTASLASWNYDELWDEHARAYDAHYIWRFENGQIRDSEDIALNDWIKKLRERLAGKKEVKLYPKDGNPLGAASPPVSEL